MTTPTYLPPADVAADSTGRLTRPLWHSSLRSLLPNSWRDRADGVIPWLPLVLALATQAVLTLRLTNTAFQDEAAYIGAGHDLIEHWLHGSPVQDFGSYFSGAPMAYPVVAGALDGLGGLWLVRLFSLACMLLATWCVWSVTARCYGRGAGLYSAWAFALTGPVAFVGALATYDAACVLAIAGALWLGVTRRGVGSAVLMGIALAAGAIVKYAGAAFIPVVLGITVVAAGWRWWRAMLAATVTLGVLAGLYLGWGSGVSSGISFTTTDRTAIISVPTSQLLGAIALDLGVVLALALFGIVVAVRSGRGRPRGIVSATVLALGWLAGAALLPVSQMRLGEWVSYEKHLAYSALFLAPLAGVGLARIAQTRWQLLAVFVVVWALALTGLPRSLGMYQWPTVTRVVAVVDADPRPGVYLSTSAESLSYYTRDDPAITWQPHYGFFDSGADNIRATIADDHFERIIFTSGPSGNVVEDERKAVMVTALRANPDYQLAAAPFEVRPYSTDEWYVYQLRR